MNAEQLTRVYHGHTIVSTSGHQKLSKTGLKDEFGKDIEQDISDGWSHVLKTTGEQFDTLGLAIAAAKATPAPKPPENAAEDQKPVKPKRK